MKSSIHLLYGIIIGILLFASTGSFKKGEFKEVQTYYLSKNPETADSMIEVLIDRGWTIMDFEIEGEHQYVLIGK